MLRVRITNDHECKQLEHGRGPLEFGRGPQRDNVPRCVVRDVYVSKDHVRVERLPNGLVRVENLSQKHPVLLPGNLVIPPTETRDLAPPIQLTVGYTTIELEPAREEALDRDQLGTIAQSLWARRDENASLALARGLGGPADATLAERMAQTFEAVVSVQRAVPGSPEFYRQTAQAVVDLAGLDRGLILLQQGPPWEVAGRAGDAEGPGGADFSHTIVRHVVAERRTCYQASPGSSSDSLRGVEAVVASPIFDGQAQVVGVVYGSRSRGRGRGRPALGPLEAQLVQMLASTLGVGLARVEQMAEAARLRIDKQSAEEADRAKGLFLASVSHELRTPLNAILAYSEMLQDEARADAARRGEAASPFLPDLGRIHGAGKHLLALINDLLDLSKLEAGKMPLVLETAPAAAMVQEVVALVRPLAAKNGNTLEAVTQGDLGPLHADVTRVRQCLINLLSNACKFTEKGAVRLEAARLPPDARRSQDWLTFTVRDTGIGMTPEQVRKLFRPFTQADAAINRRFGGTGLGLAISQKFCQRMGGEITVQSETGKGSAFTLWLPAVVSAAAGDETASETARSEEGPVGGEEKERAGAAAPTPSSPLSPPPASVHAPAADATARAAGGRLLVVDDNEDNRDTLRRRLERLGYAVETAEDGRQALERVRGGAFDLVLLDIMMPQIDGYQVLQQVKADPALRDIPVIMTSALDDLQSVVRCIELGAEDYLPKPCDPVLLRARVRASLEKKRLRDQELNYLRSVATVTAAASAVESGTFDGAALGPVGERPDALGQLARVFMRMAGEVQKRERRMEQEMRQLRIEIDEARKARQVAEITETDYFQSLREKAAQLRRRAHKPGE